jgi:O-antigen/teichoic acid export membrane protein
MNSRMLRRLHLGYRPGRLGKNAIIGTIGLGVRAIVQAAYLLILSRWLRAEGYGLFAGSVALMALCAPVASWGSLVLVTRHIAHDRRRSRAMWATALMQIGVMGGLVALGLFAMSTFLPQRLPLASMLLLAVSELIMLPVTWAATSQCYALERGPASAVAVCLGSVGRVLAVSLAVAGGVAATPAHAAIAHFAGSALAVAAATVLVARVDGWPQWGSRMRLRESLREGTPYAVSNVAGSGYQEVDKFLMLQSLGAAVVGPYTVAFRVVSIFLMPVTALISASLPRLMARAGSSDGRRTYRAMLLSGVGYGVLAGVVILLVEPWIPRIFGSDYASATHYLGLLALWPPLFALRHCLATHLTAHHRQAIRSYVEIAGLCLVVVLNLLLLPRIGAEAAVLALLVLEVLVAGVMALLVRQDPRTEGHQV